MAEVQACNVINVSDEAMNIRIDFDNKQHHFMEINKGDSKELVVDLIRDFAVQIQNNIKD